MVIMSYPDCFFSNIFPICVNTICYTAKQNKTKQITNSTYQYVLKADPGLSFLSSLLSISMQIWCFLHCFVQKLASLLLPK